MDLPGAGRLSQMEITLSTERLPVGDARLDARRVQRRSWRRATRVREYARSVRDDATRMSGRLTQLRDPPKFPPGSGDRRWHEAQRQEKENAARRAYAAADGKSAASAGAAKAAATAATKAADAARVAKYKASLSGASDEDKEKAKQATSDAEAAKKNADQKAKEARVTKEAAAKAKQAYRESKQSYAEKHKAAKQATKEAKQATKEAKKAAKWAETAAKYYGSEAAKGAQKVAEAAKKKAADADAKAKQKLKDLEDEHKAAPPVGEVPPDTGPTKDAPPPPPDGGGGGSPKGDSGGDVSVVGPITDDNPTDSGKGCGTDPACGDKRCPKCPPERPYCLYCYWMPDPDWTPPVPDPKAKGGGTKGKGVGAADGGAALGSASGGKGGVVLVTPDSPAGPPENIYFAGDAPVRTPPAGPAGGLSPQEPSIAPVASPSGPIPYYSSPDESPASGGGPNQKVPVTPPESFPGIYLPGPGGEVTRIDDDTWAKYAEGLGGAASVTPNGNGGVRVIGTVDGYPVTLRGVDDSYPVIGSVVFASGEQDMAPERTISTILSPLSAAGAYLGGILGAGFRGSDYEYGKERALAILRGEGESYPSRDPFLESAPFLLLPGSGALEAGGIHLPRIGVIAEGATPVIRGLVEKGGPAAMESGTAARMVTLSGEAGIVADAANAAKVARAAGRIREAEALENALGEFARAKAAGDQKVAIEHIRSAIQADTAAVAQKSLAAEGNVAGAEAEALSRRGAKPGPSKQPPKEEVVPEGTAGDKSAVKPEHIENGSRISGTSPGGKQPLQPPDSAPPPPPPPRGSVWDKPPAIRGEEIETALGHNVPPTYPTIDKWEHGIATSIKSVDLRAKSYADPCKLRCLLDGYVDDVAGFTGADRAGLRIEAEDILGRQLEVAVPQGAATTEQAAAIDAAAERARSMGVRLVVREVR